MIGMLHVPKGTSQAVVYFYILLLKAIFLFSDQVVAVPARAKHRLVLHVENIGTYMLIV